MIGRIRDALTGRWTTRAQAQAHPESTVEEATDPVHPAARELVAAWEGDDTGLTDPLTPYFEKLRDALGAP